MSTVRPAHKAVIPAAGLAHLASRHLVAEAAGAATTGVLVAGEFAEANAQRVDPRPEPATAPHMAGTHRLPAPRRGAVSRGLRGERRRGAVSRGWRCDHAERAGLRAAVRLARERADAAPDFRRWPEELMAGGG